MFKKTMTYTDYNGVERTEVFYFNLTKAELMQMQFGTTGGLENMISKIIASHDVPQIVATFQKIIFAAYGEKSDDGRRFIKKDSDGRLLAEKFAETEAYSDLWMELASDDKAAAEFINKILPEAEKSSIPAPANN